MIAHSFHQAMLVDTRSMQTVYKTPSHPHGTLLDMTFMQEGKLSLVCAYDDGHVVTYDRRGGIKAYKAHPEPGKYCPVRNIVLESLILSSYGYCQLTTIYLFCITLSPISEHRQESRLCPYDLYAGRSKYVDLAER